MSIRKDFILGMAKVGESVKILLDINRVLSGDALHRIGDENKAGASATHML